MPGQLIPYQKFTITFLVAVSEFQTEHSGKESLDHFYPAITTPAQLEDVREIVQIALEKLKISQMISFECNLEDFISYTLNYVSETDEKIRGPTALAWDYYNINGSYYRNSQFLYGAASQFR